MTTMPLPLPFTALDELRKITAAFEAEVRAQEADGTLEKTTAKLAWTGREVVAHLSAIYRWCTEVVSTGAKVIREPEGPLNKNAAQWFGESQTLLLSELSAHTPQDSAFTFQRDNRTVGFWHRRMLHETLIHLWDLRSIRDPHPPAPTEVSALVHADGVSELFEAYADRVDEELRAQFSGTLRLQATDVGSAWIVGPRFAMTKAENDVERAADAATEAETEATISATAGDLLLLVWNRASPLNAGFVVDGDTSVIDGFSSAHLHP